MTENNTPEQEPNFTPKPPPPPNITPPFQQQAPPPQQPQQQPQFSPPPRRRAGSFVLGLFLLIGFIIFSLYMLVSSFLPGVSTPDYTSNTVAILEIDGAIMDPTSFREQLAQLEDNDQIKAVVVSINSPGGAVGTSQEIFTELRKLAKDRTVVASMGDLAASGGYYSAIGTDYIFANRGTITGSIGVLMQIMNFGGLMEKVGADMQAITSGKFKNVPNVSRPPTDLEREYLKSTVDELFDQFLTDVLSVRQSQLEKKYLEIAELEKVDEKLFIEYMKNDIADGRIFSGRQALKVGLIDEIGTLDDAVDYAAKLAGISGEPEMQKLKKTPTLIDALTGKAQSMTSRFAPGISLQYRMWF